MLISNRTRKMASFNLDIFFILNYQLVGKYSKHEITIFSIAKAQYTIALEAVNSCDLDQEALINLK